VRFLTQEIQVVLRTGLLGLFFAWAKCGRGNGPTHAGRAPLRGAGRLVQPDAGARGYMGAARSPGRGQLRRDLRAQSRRQLATRHPARPEPVLEHGRGALRTAHPGRRSCCKHPLTLDGFGTGGTDDRSQGTHGSGLEPPLNRHGFPVLDVANCKAPVVKCQARGVNR
jgi:hypothetical protein